ncbi:hypothetical protein MKW98_004301 [Papaver atlanticum]|uniref:FBD domain-containing protein n=1 Tax=Papaver atlanticum TaxID=357466 RepID=A0AAD4XTR0_9MAGN|nr:hypothetical protein MKW98_004301 [Papaver atlanticum]
MGTGRGEANPSMHWDGTRRSRVKHALGRAYEIPERLLNCKSLKKLTMYAYGNARYADVILPRSMNLPQLKFLSFTGLSISDVESSKRLFSSCPVLETLKISDCDIRTDNQKNLIVDSLSAKKFLYIDYRHRHLQPRNNPTANIIKLHAPNLEQFTCRWSSLYGENNDIISGFLEVLSQAPDLLDCQPPRFSNLQHLGLEMWSTRGCLRAIAYLLSISPNIVTMVLESKETNLVDIGDGWEAGLPLQGMLSHLEYVRIEEVEGCDAELKLLSFLLQNASVLEEVVLYPRATIESPDRVSKQFGDKLRALPRASHGSELCGQQQIRNQQQMLLYLNNEKTRLLLRDPSRYLQPPLDILGTSESLCSALQPTSLRDGVL